MSTMEILPLAIDDVLLIKPKIFHDERGFFFESYHKDKFAELSINTNFVQDNVSFSLQNVLRGLHFQLHPGQDKLVYCSTGKIFDVAVDIRKDSKTFGKWVSAVLDDECNNMLFIPKGFAHGFCVISPFAKVHYKVSSFYEPNQEKSLKWNDSALNISWPIKTPILSQKDQNSLSFNEVIHFL